MSLDQDSGTNMILTMVTLRVSPHTYLLTRADGREGHLMLRYSDTRDYINLVKQNFEKTRGSTPGTNMSELAQK